MITHAGRDIRLRTHSSLPASENPGLFPSNFLARIAQVIHMIEIHTGEHGTISVKNIYSVQTSAQSHLQYRDIHFGPYEQFHCRQRAKLEISQGNTCPDASGLYSPETIAQLVVACFLPAYSHALVITQ